MTPPARPWSSLLTRRPPVADLPPRETPPLLDELRAIEQLIHSDGPPRGPRPPDATELRLYGLALDAASQHRRQETERHEFTLSCAKRKERQDAFARWLHLAVVAALTALVVAAAAALIVGIVTGHVDPRLVLDPVR
jgi:hypothetical protein